MRVSGSRGLMLRGRWLVFAFVTFAVFAHGVDAKSQDDRWVKVGGGNDFVVYVDRLSARQVDSAIAEVWTSWQYTTEQTFRGNQYNKTVSLFRLDCKTTRSMLIESDFYLNDQLQKNV